MAARKMKATREQFELALQRCQGRPAMMARELKMSVRSVHNYFDRWPELRENQEQFHEERLDKAEMMLEKAVLKGEAWAICFTLKTQGRKRGWVERFEAEITGKGGGPLSTRLEIVEEIVDGGDGTAENNPPA